MKQSTASTVLLMTLALAACTPQVATRGNLVSQTKFPLVQPQKSTRADVVRAWGPPTTTSPFNPNIWYYIGETTSQRGIYAPEVEKRRMICVKFDPANNDTVIDVAEIDPKQGKDIEIVSRTTPNAGKEFTAVQQFIGNLGKFNQEAPKK